MFPYTLEVQFEDGFTFSDPDFALVFSKVLYEESHGKLTKFIARGEEEFTVDMTELPENARPVHYVVRTLTHDMSGNVVGETAKHHFGYQYTSPDGKNVKDIRELP